MLDSPRVQGGAALPLVGSAYRGLFQAAAPPTPGIVSVMADAGGDARIWRRTGSDAVVLEERRYPTWLLAADLELIRHLPVRHLSRDDLGRGFALADELGDEIGHVVLAGEGERLRHLLLARSLADLEPALLDAWNKQDQQPATRLADLRPHLLVLPPTDQFLLISGETYYAGLPYAAVRRLQFDLETTGLNEHRDRIFMVSLLDSTGWRDCLDTGSMSEAELLQRFVETVQQRDPDVLENHNIFAFDLRFLVQRARALGVKLTLGRDGSEPVAERDTVRLGGRSESFGRWLIAGRESVDTLHAVKQYGVRHGGLPRHGLKEVARHFGLAKDDREYVPGAEIWTTFQRDPERVRRYAGDDVEEVDGLSRLLMPEVMALANVSPRSLEQTAVDRSARALLDPLLLRATIAVGQAPPRPGPSAAVSRFDSGPRPRLTRRGVAGRTLRLAAIGLAAHLVAAQNLRPHGDDVGVLPQLARRLLDLSHSNADTASAGEELAEALPAYLSDGGAVFGDRTAAAVLAERVGEAMEALVGVLGRFGGRPLELDGTTLLLAVPEEWSAADERATLAAAEATLPRDARLRVLARYNAVFLHSARSAALRGEDGTVSLVGSAFTPAKQERFGERFVREAVARLLAGDIAGIRALFLETVQRLRGHAVPVEDLCVQATLYRSPTEYRRASRRDEAYEVLLAAGQRTWRVGQRIRYFVDRSGARRLVAEGQQVAPGEADAEHYVRRLRTVYAQHLAPAFAPDDATRLFRVPEPHGGLFDTLDDEAVAGIRPITV